MCSRSAAWSIILAWPARWGTCSKMQRITQKSFAIRLMTRTITAPYPSKYANECTALSSASNQTLMILRTPLTIVVKIITHEFPMVAHLSQEIPGKEAGGLGIGGSEVGIRF